LMARRSFTAYGTPCSGPRTLPAAISCSARRASASARSGATVTKALSRGSSFPIRSRYDCVSSTAEIARERRRRPSSVAGRERTPAGRGGGEVEDVVAQHGLPPRLQGPEANGGPDVRRELEVADRLQPLRALGDVLLQALDLRGREPRLLGGDELGFGRRLLRLVRPKDAGEGHGHEYAAEGAAADRERGAGHRLLLSGGKAAH